MPSFLNSDYQGILGTLDGTTATVSVWKSDVTPTNTPQTLADLAGIGTESDATAYTRQTVALAWSNIDHRLRLAAPVTLDLDGDTDVYVFVFSLPGGSDAARDVLAMLPLPVPVAGYDGFILNPLNGIAGVFSDDGPGTPQTWGADSGATAYLDRGRVWLDGAIVDSGGTGALGTLPTGHRPSGDTYLPIAFTNDATGTAESAAGTLTITAAGNVGISSTIALTGNIIAPLTGLSFLVAS